MAQGGDKHTTVSTAKEAQVDNEEVNGFNYVRTPPSNDFAFEPVEKLDLSAHYEMPSQEVKNKKEDVKDTFQNQGIVATAKEAKVNNEEIADFNKVSTSPPNELADDRMMDMDSCAHNEKPSQEVKDEKEDVQKKNQKIKKLIHPCCKEQQNARMAIENVALGLVQTQRSLT